MGSSRFLPSSLPARPPHFFSHHTYRSFLFHSVLSHPPYVSSRRFGNPSFSTTTIASFSCVPFLTLARPPFSFTSFAHLPRVVTPRSLSCVTRRDVTPCTCNMTTPLPAPFYATPQPRTPTPARALFSLGGNTHRPFIARCVHEALVVWRDGCGAASVVLLVSCCWCSATGSTQTLRNKRRAGSATDGVVWG